MSDNDFEKGEFDLLRLVPQILRARDFRLYMADGRRLVDLWLNGGAAVLGHTPPSVLREIKNTASRGLYAPFPHFAEQRFIKALSRLLPGRKFKIYAAPPAEITQAAGITRNGKIALWRPFLDAPPDGQSRQGEQNGQSGESSASAAGNSRKTPPLVIPVLPGIQGWRNGLPLGLCVCAFLPEAESELSRILPPGDFLSPVLLTAATRGIWDIIAAKPERANVRYLRVDKALKDSCWRRQGIYLFSRNVSGAETQAAESAPANNGDHAVREVWDALFRRFLEAGFLLPPVPEHPLILPGVLSPGEEAKLAEVVRADISG